MKKGILYITLLIPLIIFSGCKSDKDTVSDLNYPTSSIASSEGEVDLVEHQGLSNPFQYSKEIGATPKDVYFVFTNTSSGNSGSMPVLSNTSPSYAVENDISADTQMNQSEGTTTERRALPQSGTDEITEWNANPPSFKALREGEMRLQSPLLSVTSYTAGQSRNFYTTTSTLWGVVSATLRKQTIADGKTVNIWVADDSWEGCSKENCMNATMVDAFSDKFFKSGSDNDIYDWVSNIYGAPWGEHQYSNLIDSDENNQIDILFYDIDSDNSITSGTLGFFHSKDNFTQATTAYSNDGLTFYMDSVLAATEGSSTTVNDDSNWDISHFWPQWIVSTLAHEFQHMIHFYQKKVLRTGNRSSDTWMNEMASMVAEDLVASKMGVNGPRGVTYSDGTAGSAGNTGGRLPDYNSYNYISVTDWAGSQASYGINYAFGAYLARNFGGALFFQNLVQNDGTGTDAVEKALESLGYSETFTSVMRKWGAAAILSDQTTASTPYRYNTGGYLSSSISGVTYQLGAINLYNFIDGSLSGPKIFTPAEMESRSIFYGHSNLLVKMADNVTGTFNSTVELPDNIKLTVVIK